MDKIERVHQEFTTVLAQWRKELACYSEEQITALGLDNDWSIGQVYMHLIQATLHFQGKAIEQCIADSANTKKLKNTKGFIVFNVLKSFPPVKIKVPASAEYTPHAPESKKEVEVGLDQVASAMQIWKEMLPKSKGGKVAHPAFSYLSASEWFGLIAMHWKHHLKQKQVLDQVIAKQ